MGLKLQITLFVVTCVVFYIILKNIKKSKLSTDLATVWILWCIGLLLLIIFPNIATYFGKLIGIVTPINAIYLIMIFILYAMLFFLFIKMSLIEEKVKNLVHIIALMEKEKQDGKDNKQD